MRVLNKSNTDYRTLAWVLALGLIGPVLGFSSFFIQNYLPSGLANSLSLLSIILWPTWWIGWFVLQCNSIFCEVSTVTGSVILNIFLLATLIYIALMFEKIGIRIAAFVLGYSALYGISFVIMDALI